MIERIGMAPAAVVAGTSLLDKVEKLPVFALDRAMVEVADAGVILLVEPGRMVPLVVAVTDAVPLYDCEDSRVPPSDCVESSVALPVAIVETLLFCDSGGSRVSLEVVIEEAGPFVG